MPFFSQLYVINQAKTLHWLQWFHVGNTILCVITASLLIDIAKHVRSFISNGSQLSGFGNYSTFAYPATYVYMFIPVICSSILGAILACDPSPSFKAWRPSKTLISAIGCLAANLVFAALLPTVPGADIITSPDTALACTWINYMEWRTIFNNPQVYPWVLDMDIACDTFRAANGMCWIVALGWVVVLYVYLCRHRRGEKCTGGGRVGIAGKVGNSM